MFSVIMDAAAQLVAVQMDANGTENQIDAPTLVWCIPLLRFYLHKTMFLSFLRFHQFEVNQKLKNSKNSKNIKVWLTYSYLLSVQVL